MDLIAMTMAFVFVNPTLMERSVTSVKPDTKDILYVTNVNQVSLDIPIVKVTKKSTNIEFCNNDNLALVNVKIFDNYVNQKYLLKVPNLHDMKEKPEIGNSKYFPIMVYDIYSALPI